MNKARIIEILNMLGSIASIAGISLLWVKGNSRVNAFDIPFFFLAVSFGFGVVAAGLFAIRYYYRRLPASADWLVKSTYFCIAVPVVTFVLILISLCGNKLLISIDWDWFTRKGMR